jgi:hypothetical protein
VNEATFNDWLLCVGPAIQAEHFEWPELLAPPFVSDKRWKVNHRLYCSNKAKLTGQNCHQLKQV